MDTFRASISTLFEACTEVIVQSWDRRVKSVERRADGAWLLPVGQRVWKVYEQTVEVSNTTALRCDPGLLVRIFEM